MKHAYRSKLLFLVLVLLYCIISASLRSIFSEYSADYAVLSYTGFLLIALIPLTIYAKNSRLLPEAATLWQAAIVAAAICLLHGDGVKIAPANPEIVVTTMACLFLLWAALGKYSLVLWIPFCFIEMIQAVTVRVFTTGINSFIISEAFGTSRAELMPFITWQNFLMLFTCILGCFFVSLVIYRIFLDRNKIQLLTMGSIFLALGVTLMYTKPTVPKQSSNQNDASLTLPWPIAETERLACAIAESCQTQDQFLSSIEHLPSPALAPSSCDTVREDSGIIIILHIGESLRADAMSINGYFRDTTPWLRANPDVINFADCISSIHHTPRAHAVMLTNARRDIPTSPPAMHATTGSFIDLFHKHGFEIHRIMGNLHGMSYAYDKVLTLCTKDAVSKYYTKGEPWNSIPIVQEILQQSDSDQSRRKNLLIVINNEGSHFPYENCDQKNPPFAPIRPNITNAAAHAQEVRNAYDSTVHYTDIYWRRLCEMLAGRPFVYVYMSDHGEFLGHNGLWNRGALDDGKINYLDTTGCRVGAFFITSPEFRSLHPSFMQSVGELKKHTDMTIAHEHLFHTMLGLFHIQSPYYDASLDLCSPEAQPYTGPQPSTPAQRPAH